MGLIVRGIGFFSKHKNEGGRINGGGGKLRKKLNFGPKLHGIFKIYNILEQLLEILEIDPVPTMANYL